MRAILSLLVLGTSGLILQMLVVRELTAVFYGNELFVGWIFFSWLLWSAAFSFLFSRWISLRSVGRAVQLAHTFVALLTPLLIWMARVGRAWCGPAIALPDLPRAMAFTFLLTSPASGLLAALFIALAKNLAKDCNQKFLGLTIGSAYLWETAGFAVGGLLYTHLLVLADSYAAAGLVQWANVLAAAAWYALPQRRSLLSKAALAIAAAGATFTTAAAPTMSRRSLQHLFPGQRILEDGQSIHGSFIITELGTQHNFYWGGSLVGSDQEAEWNEQVIHLPLLCHPAPRRVLLLGGGFTGAIAEILKHSPQSVDYVEPNPALLQAARRYLSGDARSALDDPRVRIIAEDGRRFLSRLRKDTNAEHYDVVLINMADPTTLFLNRYYTLECFGQIHDILAPAGLAATHTSFSPDFIGPEQIALTSSIYESLRAVFPSVAVLAEYAAFFIASTDPAFSPDPSVVNARMAERRLSTCFVNPAMLEYRLTTDRNRQLRAALEKAAAQPNRDFHPQATFLAVVRWACMLHPAMAKGLTVLGRPSPILLAALLALWALIFGVAAWRHSAASMMMAMSTASLTVMACETCILLIFQIAIGHLYYRMALIVTAVMLGMSAGSYMGIRFPARSARRLSAIHTAMIVAVLAPLWAVASLYLRTEAITSPLQPMLMATAFLVGLLGGAEFAGANQILFADGRSDHGRTGWLYGADLLGSCCGALLTALWLFPVLGLNATLAILAALNATAALALARSPTC